MKNIIFIAPPASGKGTQSSMLEQEYGYIHISTGELLREEINKNSDLGQQVKNIINKGDFVDDDIVIEMLNKKLINLKGKPFILDGSPRTVNQAIALSNIFDKLKIDDYIIIYLNVSKKEALKRSLGRLVCKCGATYNLYDDSLKPKHKGKCDLCGRTLLKRDDDTKKKFLNRFNTYLKETKPILVYYKKINKYHEVNASINPSVTFNEIKELIND